MVLITNIWFTRTFESLQKIFCFFKLIFDITSQYVEKNVLWQTVVLRQLKKNSIKVKFQCYKYLLFFGEISILLDTKYVHILMKYSWILMKCSFNKNQNLFDILSLWLFHRSLDTWFWCTSSGALYIRNKYRPVGLNGNHIYA